MSARRVDPAPLLPSKNADCSDLFAGVEQSLGFWPAAMSLAVSMLGTGIVAFPYAFTLGGYIAVPAIFIVVSQLAYVSYTSLITCTITEHVSSYGALLRNIPKGWSYYSNFALWWLLILAITSYVLVATSMIQSFFPAYAGDEPLMLQNSVLFGIILLFLFPVCLAKSFHGLAFISTYCSGAIVAVTALIVWKAIDIWVHRMPLPESLSMTPKTEPGSVALTIPILANAMFGHMSISQVYAELQPKVKEQANRVALTACAGCAVLYMAVGLSGYAAFGRGSQPDVVAQIIAHTGEDSVTLLIQFLLMTFVLLKTPLLILPLRRLTVEMVAPGVNASELPVYIHVGLTYGLLASVYLALIAMPNLGTVLELLGAACVIPICFLVPARLSWSLETPRPVVKCVIMALFGFLASAISLFVFATS